MVQVDIIFLSLALLLILSYWIFVFIIFYHLVRFGIGTQPKIASAIFVFGSLSLFFVSVIFFSNIDWNLLGTNAIRLLKESSINLI